jgi:hypothetical protein
MVAGIGLSVVYLPEKYQPSQGWFGLALSTVFLLGCTVRVGREFWRRPMFWVACAGVFAARGIGWAFVIRAYPAFRLIWFAFTAFVEFWVIGYFLGWCEIATDGFQRLRSLKSQTSKLE